MINATYGFILWGQRCSKSKRHALYFENNGNSSLFPAWRFVRGFVDPSISAGYTHHYQLKVELKNQPGDAAKQGGTVKVTRGKTTTDVPTTSTESYRNMLQQNIIIGN